MITTHVLDTAGGRPAQGVGVRLEAERDGAWVQIARADTNADGRCPDLLGEDAPLAAGAYRLTFATGEYFARQGVEGFYPEAAIVFTVRDASAHHHVPLLLSPFGYSTYRGS